MYLILFMSSIAKEASNSFWVYILKALKISRPRFWFYLAGPFLIGFTSSAQSVGDFLTAKFWLLLFYFLLPANFMLYGINDLYDTETDALNVKKNSLENKALGLERKITKIVVGISFVFAVLPFLLLNDKSLILFLLFLFLSIFYSLPPLRFKARPFFDFISNILYILPGLIIFYDETGIFPSYLVVLSASFWVFAMHLFSAIPDIEPDFKSGVKTSAVYFGKKRSLLLCFVFWLISFFLALPILKFFGLLFVVYPLIPLYVLLKLNNNVDLFKIYWLYPYINLILGFLLFAFLGLRVLTRNILL